MEKEFVENVSMSHQIHSLSENDSSVSLVTKLKTLNNPTTAMRLSLLINIILFCTKLVISIVSSSIAIIASFIDSLFDLGVQWVMFYIDRRINKTRKKSDIISYKNIKINKYPRGCSILLLYSLYFTFFL